MRMDNTTGFTNGNLFRCFIGQEASISMSLIRNATSGEVKFKGTVLSQQNAVQASDLQKSLDFSGWNHFALYLDKTQTIYLSVNEVTLAQFSILGSNSVFSTLVLQSTSCQLGGIGDLASSMRHVVFASGLQTSIGDYHNKYAHSLPAALDSNLIAYYSLENEDKFNRTFTIKAGNVTFGKRFEPEYVCRCIDNDDQSSNYPRLTATTAIFNDIQQVKYPTSSNFQIEVKFTMQLKRYSNSSSLKSLNYHEIVSHNGLWSLGVVNKTYFQANIKGLQAPVILSQTSLESGRMRNQTLFIGQWISYSFTLTQTLVSLKIDDLTSKTPATITVNFSTPLKLDEVLTTAEAAGSFSLKPQGVDALFSRVTYKVSDVQVFDFKLSLDNYLQTSPTVDVTKSNFMSVPIIGYYQSGDFKLTPINPGLTFEEVSGPCNQSDPSFSFDGLACKNPSKQLALNQKSNPYQRVEGYLKSTNTMYTFEVWFKFQGFQSSDQAIIMAVHGLFDTQSTQIAITKSTSVDANIQCDPNPRIPRINTLEPVTIYTSVQTNVWMHYACTSNSNAKELRAYLYNLNQQLSYNGLQSGSNLVSLPDQVFGRTIFGNNLNGTAKFVGNLKELRIWNVPRSQMDVESFRFQSLPYQGINKNQLLVYSKLNLGYGIRQLELDLVAQNSTSSLYLASQSYDPKQSFPSQVLSQFSWVSDVSAPHLCPPDTFLDEQSSCCTKASFYISATKTTYFNDVDNKSYLILKVQIKQNFSSSINDDFYKHTWTVYDVNNFSGNKTLHINSLQALIYQQANDSEREVWIAQEKLNSNASYSFKVSVRSLIMNYKAVQEAMVTVRPDCPMIKMSPKFRDQTPLRVSSKMNPQLLRLSVEVKDQCSDPQIVNHGIQWSLSSHIAAYNLSNDSMALTFSTLPQSDQILIVTAKLQYTNANDPLSLLQTVEDQQVIEFYTQPFSLGLNDLSSPYDFSRNDMIFDPSQTDLKVNYPIDHADMKLEYVLDCPSYLYLTDAIRSIRCRPDSTNGYTKLRSQDTVYVNYMNYTFNYTMNSSILGYSESKVFTINFNQQSYYSCPRLGLNQFTTYSIADEKFLIRPTVILDCQTELYDPDASITKYSLSNITWQVDGFTDPTQFLDVNGLIAQVRRNSTILKPHFSTNITVQAVLNNGTVIKGKTQFFLTKANLIINVDTNHPSGIVPFNQTVVLNAINTIDPDFPNNTQLQANWTLQGGAVKYINQTKLTLTPFDRLDMGMNIGNSVQEQVELDIWNINFPENQGKKTIYIKFEGQNDFNQPAISNCQIILSNPTESYKFSRTNVSDIALNATLSPCFQNTNLKPDKSKFYVQINGVYKQTDRVNITKEQISALQPGQQLTIDFIYFFSYPYEGSTEKYYEYFVKSVSITLLSTSLEVRFKDLTNLTVNVGQESSYTLDASASYDDDNPGSQNTFTYMWNCPAGMACDGTGPTLTITKSMRMQINKNLLGSYFQVGVQVYSAKKQSEMKFVTITVIEQNYKECLKAMVENSENGLLRISRDQEYPLMIRVATLISCANVQIDSANWTLSSTQKLQKFWRESPASPLQIVIPASSFLPNQTQQMSMNVQLDYRIIITNDTIDSLLAIPFTFKIEPSLLVAVVQTNLLTSQVYAIGSSQPLQLNASTSYDPDSITSQVKCQWTCPPSMNNCRNFGCDLSIQPSQLQMSNASNMYEVAEFTLTILSSDSTKQLSRSVFITLVSPNVTRALPLCYIKNLQGKQSQLDIDQELVFYPKCLPLNLNQQYSNGFKFEWYLSPSVQGLKLTNNYTLTIAPYQLWESLSNKANGKLTIQLRVYNAESEYFVTRTYKIPMMIDGISDIKVQALPALVDTMFTLVKIEISNYTLKQNQTYRLRVIRQNDNEAVIFDKFTSSTVDVYLPKNTVQLYLDVLEGKRVTSSDYIMYSKKIDGIVIQEAAYVTKQMFNSLVMPRLQTQLDNFDYNDQTLVLQQLDNMISLQNIIQGVSKDNQPKYNSLLYSQVSAFLMNTVSKSQRTSLITEQSPTQRRILNDLLNVLTSMYLTDCIYEENLEIANIYLGLIDNELLSENWLYQLRVVNSDRLTKLSLIDSLQKLTKSTCLNESQKTKFTRLSNQFQLSTFIESEYTSTSEYPVVYMISDFDRLSDNVINYRSNMSLYSVKLQSQNLPVMASYLTVKDFTNEFNVSTQFVPNRNYLASQKIVQVNLHDDNFDKLKVNDPSFNLELEMSLHQPIIQQQLSKLNLTQLNMTVQCYSKHDDSQIFNPDSGLIANVSSIYNLGTVKCTSKHLTQFAVFYSPLSNYYLPSEESHNQPTDQDLIFQKVPLLIYLLPALLLLFILLFAVLGLIMAQLEHNKPKRLYNQSTLAENLTRYSFTRLWGCAILQFNPFFNYIIKPNYYLNRPLRLMILINYLLMFSSASLVYFMCWKDGKVRVADIFWFGCLLMLVMILARPRVQDLVWRLLYPEKELTDWKSREYKYKERKQQRPKSAIEKKDPQDGSIDNQIEERPWSAQKPKKKVDNDDLVNGYLENIEGLGNSAQRLVGPQKISHNEDGVRITQYADSPANSRADEIIMFRDTKKKTNQKPQKHTVPQQQSDPVEIEMNDLSQSRLYDNSMQQLKRYQSPEEDLVNNRGSADLLRSSLDSQNNNNINNNQEFAGFKFDPLVVTDYPSSKTRNEVAIDLDDSVADFEREENERQADEDEYYYEQEKESEDQQNEGGEEEEQHAHQPPNHQQEEIKDDDEENHYSPSPFLEQQKQMSKPRRRNVNNNQQEIELSDLTTYGKNQNSKQGGPEQPCGNEQDYQDESTTSVESLYKNYRELKPMPTYCLRYYLGVALHLLTFTVLIVLHGVLMPDMREYQFSNWISCTLFSFMLMIFFLDSLLYALVAWALLRTKGKINKRQFCSFFQVFVYWPLGKWKYLELEIELAKLKDFDKEFYVAAKI